MIVREGIQNSFLYLNKNPRRHESFSKHPSYKPLNILHHNQTFPWFYATIDQHSTKFGCLRKPTSRFKVELASAFLKTISALPWKGISKNFYDTRTQTQMSRFSMDMVHQTQQLVKIHTWYVHTYTRAHLLSYVSTYMFMFICFEHLNSRISVVPSSLQHSNFSIG